VLDVQAWRQKYQKHLRSIDRSLDLGGLGRAPAGRWVSSLP
jgi:hypothetical protein